MASSSSAPARETTSEEAPLLDSSDETYDEPAPTPRPQLIKPVIIFTILSLIFAAIVWPFLITLKVFWVHEPEDYHGSWRIQDDSAALLGLSITAAVFALANLIRLRFWKKLLPLFINLIADFVLAFYLIGVSAEGISTAVDFADPCYRYRMPYDPPPITDRPVDPSCAPYARKVLILSVVVMSVGVVLGITNIILGLLSCILAYRSKFWRQIGPLRLPTGTFSVEFTVKIHKQEQQQGASQPATPPAEQPAAQPAS